MKLYGPVLWCALSVSMPMLAVFAPKWSVTRTDGVKFSSPFTSFTEISNVKADHATVIVRGASLLDPSVSPATTSGTLTVYSLDASAIASMKDWDGMKFLEMTDSAENKVTDSKSLAKGALPDLKESDAYDKIFATDVLDKLKRDFAEGDSISVKLVDPRKTWGSKNFAIETAKLRETDAEIVYAVFIDRDARKVYRISVCNSGKPMAAVAIAVLTSSSFVHEKA